MAAGMEERTGDELLGLPVRLHGIQLGRPVDLLLDPHAQRAVGLDLLCGDEVHRFLPLPTAAVGREEIRILSPFVLLEQHELDFYRARTLALGRLRGRAVERHGRKIGLLQDVVVAGENCSCTAGPPSADACPAVASRRRVDVSLPFEAPFGLFAPGTLIFCAVARNESPRVSMVPRTSTTRPGTRISETTT